MYKAMILAAGKGERLLPYTAHTPKPLMSLRRDFDDFNVEIPTLIEHQINGLKNAGFTRLVINIHHLGGAIRAALGDGQRWKLSINYSEEPLLLDTAGGIAQALPMLGEKPFAMVSADVLTNYPFEKLLLHCQTLVSSDHSAHIVLGENPPHHPKGDFNFHTPSSTLIPDDMIDKYSSVQRGTFLGLAVFHPRVFAEVPRGKPYPLRPILQTLIMEKKITASWHDGAYFDCGTIDRLNIAREWYSNRALPKIANGDVVARI